MNTPEHVAELSLEWLEGILTHSNSGCHLLSFTVDSDHGPESFMAEVIRVVLAHSSPGCSPGSLIIKFPATGGQVNFPVGKSGPYANEAEVYGLLAEHSSLAVPALVGSFEAQSSRHVVMVLEDIIDASTESQLLGCSVENALSTIRAFAEIHRTFWDYSGLPASLTGKQYADTIGGLIGDGWAAFLARYEGRLQETLPVWEWMMSNLEPIGVHRRSEPATLCHGDAHLDNVLFTSALIRPVVIVDWQTAGSGLAAHDICHFLVGDLTVEDRRQYEMKLLRDYHGRLTDPGGIDYSFDEFFIDYRAAVLRPMFRPPHMLLRASRASNPTDLIQLADAKFERLSAAITDLDPVDAMQSLGY